MAGHLLLLTQVDFHIFSKVYRHFVYDRLVFMDSARFMNLPVLPSRSKSSQHNQNEV